MIDIDFMNLS